MNTAEVPIRKKVEKLVRSYRFKDKSLPEPIQIFDEDQTVARYTGTPSYVAEATERRMTSTSYDPNWDKIILDKWGRKDSSTKQYVETPELLFYRAALLAADGMAKNDPTVNREERTRRIFEAFDRREIFPNTPYMANGGHKLIAEDLEARLKGTEHYEPIRRDLEQEKKVREQLFACFVLGVYDSRTSIFKTMFEAADIQASIGGTGFNFSNLRPGNEVIHGTDGLTDGPVTFMAAYSHVLGKTMNQGGKRDGANMFMLDWNHPDILRFMYSKIKDGEIPAANISVAIDHEFMQAAKSEGEDRFYPLVNPHFNPEKRPHIARHYTEAQLRQSLKVAGMNKKARVSLLMGEDGVSVLSPWLPEGLDEEYRVIGKIKDGKVMLDAKKVLRHLSYSAWFNGEPGIIVTGHINDHNPTHPTHYRDYILEQNDDHAREITGELKRKYPDRPLETLVDEYVFATDEDGKFVNLPTGVGIIRATNPCGEKPLLSDEACVLGHINLEKILDTDPSEQSGYKVNWNKFRDLTDMMYEILDNSIDQNQFTNDRIATTQRSNRKIGIGFMGLANMLYKLEIPYDSQEGREFVDKLLTFWEQACNEDTERKAELFGAFPNFAYSHHRTGKPKRNAITRTLAPTGTTGTAAQTTGGMEPEYALAMTRTTVQGTTIELLNPVLREKVEKYRFYRDEEELGMFNKFIREEGNGSMRDFTIERGSDETDESFHLRQNNLDALKKIFVTTYDISPEAHVRMEAVVQDHVDDAISKTTNFRSNASPDDIERAFMLAYDLGIKGLTFYRDGTRKGQPLQVGKPRSADKAKLEELINVRGQIMQRLQRPRPDYVEGPKDKFLSSYPGKSLFVGIGFEDSDINQPYESFIDVGKSGEDLKAITEGYARLISLAFHAGIPVGAVVDQLKGIEGKTQEGIGPTSVKSLPDAIAKGLETVLNKKKAREEEADKIKKRDNNLPIVSSSNGSGNLCPSCSGQLVFEESCEKCLNPSCGFSRC